MSGLRRVTLAVRFGCELAALASWASVSVTGSGHGCLVSVRMVGRHRVGRVGGAQGEGPVPISTWVVIELVLFGAAGALGVANQPAKRRMPTTIGCGG